MLKAPTSILLSVLSSAVLSLIGFFLLLLLLGIVLRDDATLISEEVCEEIEQVKLTNIDRSIFTQIDRPEACTIESDQLIVLLQYEPESSISHHKNCNLGEQLTPTSYAVPIRDLQVGDDTEVERCLDNVTGMTLDCPMIMIKDYADNNELPVSAAVNLGIESDRSGVRNYKELIGWSKPRPTAARIAIMESSWKVTDKVLEPETVRFSSVPSQDEHAFKTASIIYGAPRPMPLSGLITPTLSSDEKTANGITSLVFGRASLSETQYDALDRLPFIGQSF